MDVKQIEAFFFEGMRQGWAALASKTSIPQLPGSKSISFSKDEFSLLDYYFVSPDSDNSYGTTLIWVAEKPVWIMHYGGWYDKRLIPFLKRALMCNYGRNIFHGGRGPGQFLSDDRTSVYICDVGQGDFSCFWGYEQIISDFKGYEIIDAFLHHVPIGQKMGEHHFFGGLF